MGRLAWLNLLLVLGCDAEQPEVPVLSASFNGREWTAAPQATVTDSGQLLIVGTTGPANAPCPYVDPCERLTLASDEAFDGAGTYGTDGNGVARFSHRDGDSVLSGYTVVGGPPTFDVTDYDPGSREVSGRFELTLALEFSAFPPGTFSLPDTIRFRNGRFAVSLSDQVE